MSVATEQVAGLDAGVGRHDIAGRGMIVIQPRAGAVFYPGSAVVHRDGVQLAEVPLSSAPRTDLVTLGRFVGEKKFTASILADANGGALNADGTPQSICVTPFSEVGTGWFATGLAETENQITESMVDRPAFWFDDGTLYATDLGGTLSYAGHIAMVGTVGPETGRVALKTGELWRVLYELFSAGQGPGASPSTSDDSARTVATSLPAGSFSGGVLTLAANGAFSTMQDGVTLEVGDKFIIPAGTITTLVVSAANSGMYQVTDLGSATTPARFTRTVRWAHGAEITPETKIRVSAEATVFKNSEWTAAPATSGLLVGTGDPSLYPDKVTQQITLVAGTFTISNVPIRFVNKTGFYFNITGGTPAGTTTGYQTKTTAGIVAGGIGTAALIVEAQATAGVIVATDVTQGNATITQ